MKYVLWSSATAEEQKKRKKPTNFFHKQLVDGLRMVLHPIDGANQNSFSHFGIRVAKGMGNGEWWMARGRDMRATKKNIECE